MACRKFDLKNLSWYQSVEFGKKDEENVGHERKHGENQIKRIN